MYKGSVLSFGSISLNTKTTRLISYTFLCYLGKPDPAFFLYAISIANKEHKAKYGESKDLKGNPSRRPLRVLHVGDSLSHDILGASLANIDSCMITDHGVHYKELEQLKYKTGTDNIEQFQSMLSPPPVSNAREEIPLLMRVCDLCDNSGFPRPSYILESFQL